MLYTCSIVHSDHTYILYFDILILVTLPYSSSRFDKHERLVQPFSWTTILSYSPGQLYSRTHLIVETVDFIRLRVSLVY